MLKVIASSRYRITPWKNGAGTSAQIAIHPYEALFPSDDFLWRVSSARITASGPFSTFPNCERILAVWQGVGIRLGGQTLEPLIPFKFSGDEPLSCELLEGPVVDLGVIYRRGRVTADMRLESLTPGVIRPALVLGQGVHLLVCAAGGFEVDGVRVVTGDTLRVDGAQDLNLRAASRDGARIFRVSMNNI